MIKIATFGPKYPRFTVSISVSEISSQAGEGDFEDKLLVSTPNQQVEQGLAVQAQNGVNMASGTSTTAPSTAITAPSTAPLQLAGPSTMEPIVPIGVHLGQDTPSVNQGARPDVTIEQTASLLRGTAPCRTFLVRSIRHPCRVLHPCHTLPLMFLSPSRFSASDPIISAGPVQVEGDVEFSNRSAGATRARPEDQITNKLRLSVQGLHQHLADPPLPTGTTLGGLAQPLGHLRPVPRGLSIRYHLFRTLKPFRLTRLRCCQTCFKLPSGNLPPSSIPALETKGTLRLRRLWLLSPL